MVLGKKFLGALVATGIVCFAGPAITAQAASSRHADFADSPNAQPATQSASTRPVGTIQSLLGNLITLKTDGGATVSVIASDSTRILRIEPGMKNLSQATTIHLQDLQIGDRILVAGQPSSDGKSIVARMIIAMAKSDLEARQAQERAQWQHGVGGLVKGVDPANGTILVNVSALGGTKAITIRTTQATILRRYAPDSVEFDDAKPGTFGQIRPGDQLRARGTRNADGTQFEAQEIVSGSFRNIAGTITSIEPAANTIHVMDLISKKPVLVKFTSESEIRELPPMLARGIAMRLRMARNGGSDNNRDAMKGNRASYAQGESAGGKFQRTRGAAGSANGLQQLLNRLPSVKITDLQKGEAVMIVSTEGAVPGQVTAITMLGGVEPILEAAPKGQRPMTLSPWSLSAPSEGGSN